MGIIVTMTEKKVGAPKGNTNAANKPEKMLFLSAVKKAMEADTIAGKIDRVRLAAESLLDQAASGEEWAIKELANRLDGKAVQATTISNPDGTPLLNGIEVSFVTRKPS